jgi:hypothetical protein
MSVRLTALAAALLFLSFPAWAQTAPASAGTEAAPVSDTATAPVSDRVAVPIWPTIAVPLPEMQPAPASFSLGAVDGVPPELVSGVTAKGYARKVPVDNQVIGQVQVLTVSKGDREETISTEGLVAQFDAGETSQLFPEKTLEVQGSKAALIAALQRLSTGQADKADKPDTRDEVSQNQTSPGGTQNDQASGYQTPTVSAVPTTQEKDPVVDMRVTRQDCPVRVDVAQGRAFQQTKEQTFTDGALTSEGQCSDSEVSYVLKKNYLACPNDIVDLAAMTAWPQFVWSYTDDAGESHQVGECAKDEETVYTITEDEARCPVFLDYSASQAVPQAALVYTNRNNAAVEVPGGCKASTKSAAVPMTENVANCPMRHDFTAGITAELSMWTYVRGGVTYQAAPCADTGRTFAHEVVYTDAAGGYVCTPITNLTTKTVTLQSRKRITVDGVPQFITDCTPDTSTHAILPTTNGCSDPSKWTHDLDAGVSYGQERFYYPKADGSPEYVTPCQNSSATYAHSVSITGYQNHDDQLWAYPLTTVTISIGGSPYTVASSEVLPGEAQIPYTSAGTVDQPSGQSSYFECDAYRETTRYERWIRPDGTEYLKPMGPGATTGPINVCVSTVIDSRNLQTGNASSTTSSTSSNGDTCSWTTTTTNVTYFQTINKVQKKNTETGIVIATTCEMANNKWDGWSTSSSSSSSGSNWVCNNPPNSSTPPTQTLFVPPCPF